MKRHMEAVILIGLGIAIGSIGVGSEEDRMGWIAWVSRLALAVFSLAAFYVGRWLLGDRDA